MTKIRIILLALALKNASAFVAVDRRNGWRHDAISSQGLAASNSDSEESTMSEAERMAAVRSLQNSFYATTADDHNDISNQCPSLHTSTGIMTNLPLWRVGWVEVPDGPIA